MEARRFDRVVKTLGRGASRRRVLRGLIAGTGGAVLARFATHEPILADPPISCSPGEKACGNFCVNPETQVCCRCKGGCTAHALQRSQCKGDSGQCVQQCGA
jgi:hypothetical protein